MNTSSRDRHFNQFVESVADELVVPLSYRSRVVHAVKRLSQQKRQWQEQAKFLYGNLRN